MVRKKLLVAATAVALALAPTLAMAAEGSTQIGSLSRTGTGGQVAQIPLQMAQILGKYGNVSGFGNLASFDVNPKRGGDFVVLSATLN